MGPGSEAGNALLRRHLEQALAGCLAVRVMIATAADAALVDRGDDASKRRKTFHVRDDAEGRVTEFDGDRFVLELRKRAI